MNIKGVRPSLAVSRRTLQVRSRLPRAVISGMRYIHCAVAMFVGALILSGPASAQNGGKVPPLREGARAAGPQADKLPAVAPDASAQIKDRTAPQPRQLQSVDVDEHLNQNIPLDLAFNDEGGKPVRLSQYFGQGKPVLLT